MNPGTKKLNAVLLLILSLSLLSFPARAEETGSPETAAETEKQQGFAQISQENIIFGQEAVEPGFYSDTNDTVPQISYKIQGASDDTYTQTVPSDVGVYTVRVFYPESEHYQAAEASADFTILSYITAIDLKIPPDFSSRVYNGELQTVPMGEIPLTFQVEGTSQLPQPGIDYNLTANLLSPSVDRDPGSLNIRVVLSMEEGLYALSPQVKTEFFFHGDVVPAPVMIQALDQNAGEGFQNDLTEIASEGLMEGHTLSQVELFLEDGSIQLKNPRITAGELDVTDQYEIILNPGRYIEQAAISEYPIAAEDLTYNGKAQALLQAPGRGENGSIVYALRYHASQSRQEEILSEWSDQIPMGKEPGIYTVNFKALGQGLPDSEEKSMVVELRPRPLTIHGTGYKVYDGGLHLPDQNVSVTLEEDQILPGEDVHIKTISGSSFQQAAAGENLKITPGNVVLAGKDAEKYSVKVASFTGTIARRPVTVKAESVDKAYGQKDPVYSYAVHGLADGEQLQGTLQREPGQNVGVYAITQGSMTEVNNPNYSITFIPGKVTVRPAKLSLYLQSSKKTIRPGRVFKLTIKAQNEEQNLMQQDWNQPSQISLIYGQRLLSAEENGPGAWTAEYMVPKDQKGSLSFTALNKDSNYQDAGDSITVKLSFFGSNPDTGDRIRFWATLLFMSALLLGGIIIYFIGIHKKR